MNKKRIFILSILIIIWLSVIFAFSNQSGEVSTSNSKGIVRNIITNVLKDRNLDDEQIDKLVDSFNYIIRKAIHFLEYFILGVLILLLFKEFKFANKDLYIVTIVLCFLMATFDETHQLFVGRTGAFEDIVLDTLGSSTYCLIYKIHNIFKNKKVN